MTASLLQIDQVGKRFGGFVALDGINLNVAPGERLGLIGPNGSGKSTLVNCICGTLQNETGSVTFDGRKLDGLAAHQRTILGLSRSFQLPRPFHSMSVADNLRIPLLYAVKARSGSHLAADELNKHCVEYLRLVGLDHKASRRPRQGSAHGLALRRPGRSNAAFAAKISLLAQQLGGKRGGSVKGVNES